MKSGLTRVLLALTIVLGVGVLIQIGVLSALTYIALKARKKVHSIRTNYETQIAPHLIPIVANLRGLVEDLSPKVKSISTDVGSLVSDLTHKVKVISTNVVELSENVKQETKHVTQTVYDVVDHTHQNTTRVDGISMSFRPIHAILEGVRIGLSTLRHKERVP
jgi:hypothetical protein